MAGYCKCGNEPSGSIKCGEFPDKLRACSLLRKASTPWSQYVLPGLCSLNCKRVKCAVLQL